MSVKIQDFSVGSPMYNLVRGYNERRGVIGLPYRGYSGNAWADVASLAEAIVAPDSIIQDVKFWNELISIATSNYSETVTSSNGTFYAQFVTAPDESLAYVPANTEPVIAIGDIINTSLVDRIAAYYASLRYVVYIPASTQNTIVIGSDQGQSNTSTSTGPGGIYASLRRFLSGGLQQFTTVHQVGSISVALPSFDTTAALPSLVYYGGTDTRTNIESDWFRHSIALNSATAFNSPDYISNATPPSKSYWQSLGALYRDTSSPNGAYEWNADLGRYGFTYAFNFAT